MFTELTSNAEFWVRSAAYYWKGRTWYFVPLLISLYLLYLPLAVLGWLVGLPVRLILRAERAEQERLERQMDAEGRNMYPLW